MSNPLRYPELTPPAGFAQAQFGTLLQFLPPGESKDAPLAAMYLSPLLARAPHLPSSERLIALAIEAEMKQRIRLTDFREPSPFATSTGLSGLSVEIACIVVPTQARERRLYIMLTDDLCYYGINYIATPEVFDRHLPHYLAAAGSIRPFSGRAVTGFAASAAVLKHYND